MWASRPHTGTGYAGTFCFSCQITLPVTLFDRAKIPCIYVPFMAQSFLMIDHTKKLPARFYVNDAGRNPVREWILGVVK
jgi:hypothetical protein